MNRGEAIPFDSIQRLDSWEEDDDDNVESSHEGSGNSGIDRFELEQASGNISMHEPQGSWGADLFWSSHKV